MSAHRKPAPDAVGRIEALAATHPEWAPWLCVVREFVAELASPAWDANPPLTETGAATSPALAGATLRPDGAAVARLLDRLLETARSRSLAVVAGTSRADPTGADEALAVFLASVNGDEAELGRQAARAGATPDGWRALAGLLPMPYLHACSRRRANASRAAWSQGYCPVCGAFPAFAEVRGIKRARHLRCGRCGCDWSMPGLACTYCANTDHDALGTLVVDDKAARWTIEICRGCSGYLKSLTTLQPTPADEILVADLASVELDLAALDRGYLRPPSQGAALDASLAPAGPANSEPATAETAPAAKPARSAKPRRWWS